ncbi:MAG: serine hydrolase family protein [Candidatus Omnitrophica bacterium]|nr:serine hydrolase family protein [Candidatus Omnitrophota bacterium]
MKKIILIHGYTSSPSKKKYQLISKELENLGVEYSIPALPGGEYPKSAEWLEGIDKEVKNTTKPVVLVGHSLGTRAALLYLDKFEQKIDTIILIAAFNNNFEENRKRRDGNYADFFDYALDIEKIKKLANKFIVVHSKDDDSIGYKQGVEIASELGAKLTSYENMSHFSGEENAESNAEYFVKFIKSVL